MGRGCFSDSEEMDSGADDQPIGPEGWPPSGVAGGVRPALAAVPPSPLCATGQCKHAGETVVAVPVSRGAAGAFSDSDAEEDEAVRCGALVPTAGLASGGTPEPVGGGAPAPALGGTSTGAFPAEELHWERQIDLGPLRKWGPQMRPLRMVTVFSGINSPLHALRRMGVDVREVASAEIKRNAWQFCQCNGLVGGCWFTDAVPLSSGEASFCKVHGRHHKLEESSLDLLVAGFPCQPYSRKRPHSSDPSDVAAHRTFMMSDVVEKVVLRWRPRVALLENVPGFDGEREVSVGAGSAKAGAGAPEPGARVNFCDAMVRRFQASGYHARAVHVSLSPWVEASGTRVYIFLADARAFGAEVVEDAARSVDRAQAQRATAPPWPLEASRDHGALGSWAPAAAAAPRSSSRALRAQHGPGGPAAWERRSARVRERWSRAGPGWGAIRERCGVGSQPWTAPQPPKRPPALLGLARPIGDRAAEILDLGFLWACRQHSVVDPNSPGARDSVVTGLVCDPTQNPEFKPWGRGLPRVCRTSKPYVYSWDRRMRPIEAFAMYGWRRANLAPLSDSDGWDLLGDSMALPTLGVALVALLGAAGGGIPALHTPGKRGKGSAGDVATPA